MAVAYFRLAWGLASRGEIVKAVMGMDGGPNDDTKRGETRQPTFEKNIAFETGVFHVSS